MSIFPTTIVLATDGSEDARSAAGGARAEARFGAARHLRRPDALEARRVGALLGGPAARSGRKL